MSDPQPTIIDIHAYWGPVNETSSDIAFERNFLAGDFITGMSFGIIIVFYFSCFSLLYTQRLTRPNTHFLLIYITLLFIVFFVFCVVQAGTVQMVYIDNRNFPGGPLAYFFATQNLAINVIFLGTFFGMTLLADALVVWRCWIIWSASNVVSGILTIAIPFLILLSSIAIGIPWVYFSSLQSQSFYSPLPLKLGTAYYSTSIGLNVIVTFLIVFRLLSYRRRLPREQGKVYLGLLAIFVESAGLYSVFAVMFLGAYAANHPINQIFLGFTTAAQQISAYLIVYRLAEGKAWKRDTMTTANNNNNNNNSTSATKPVFSTIHFSTTQGGGASSDARARTRFAGGGGRSQQSTEPALTSFMLSTRGMGMEDEYGRYGYGYGSSGEEVMSLGRIGEERLGGRGEKIGDGDGEDSPNPSLKREFV